ncbi:PAS domain S-box protein (plasmid) [Planococcus maritimus]|uniref:PAS domain-containing protein n=1 Tax=Planococcus maritimus TaxID=192421 RepID=UPI00313A2974
MKYLKQETRNQLLEAMINGSRVATVVTDPQQEDNPIIYSNQIFEQLTGYTQEEIIGRNCRFLQGEDTDQSAVQQIREAIANQHLLVVTLKNYRKDGTSFWNRLQIKPVKVGKDVYFVGTQTDVTHEVHQQLLLNEKEHELNEQLLPIMPISSNIGAVALVGRMNNHRFSVLTSKLSDFVQQTSTHYILIDVTGVLWERDFLYHHLLMVQDVLRLMGSELHVTGISPVTAIQIAQNQEDTRQLKTYSTVQQAMQRLLAA